MERTRAADYVLLADDDAEDIEIVTHALSELDKPPRVVIVHNGKHVMEHLQKEMDRCGNAPSCALIMDMNMPHMDGRETVVAIKKNESLKDLPILLFSTCKNRADELFARKWGVQLCEKPDSIQSMDQLARTIVSICGNSSIGSNSGVGDIR